MAEYRPTIGLEIHAELKTQTKMFCNSKNNPDESIPNINVCPVCMGHPGTLPTINKEAVRHVLRVGAAVGGTRADFTEFDRKNYFYPDIPKGYQISQYQYPLVSGGTLRGVALTRIHLEEDTARSIHDREGNSLVDFNRAGIPLMELVTEPVVGSAEEAASFAKELQLLLRYLGVSDANLEKGEMRIEANVSVSKNDDLGTKVEVKNLNSFASVRRAISYEIERQIDVLEDGGDVVQETRGWDESKQRTFPQRKKEYSHDYRYFPEPDLPKLVLSDIRAFDEGALKETLPELPGERRDRYTVLSLKPDAVETLVADETLAGFFDAVSDVLKDVETSALAANYLLSDVLGVLRDRQITIDGSSLSPESFAELIGMVHVGDISSRGAKDILTHMLTDGGAPRDIAEARGLLQESDEEALIQIVKQVLADNPKVIADYKSGKESALKFLIGQGMRLSKGAGNPRVLETLFKTNL